MADTEKFSFSHEKPYLFRNRQWHCAIQFFQDRVEYSWDAWGLDAEKGKTVFLRAELAQTLGEYSGTTPVRGNFGRLPGIYLVLSIFSYVLLPMPWRSVTLLFVLFSGLSSYKAIKALQRNDWLVINTLNGKPAVSMKVTNWSEDERKEFWRAYRSFMTPPNQSKDPTLASGTPGAGH
jgi:hypothetical protein